MAIIWIRKCPKNREHQKMVLIFPTIVFEAISRNAIYDASKENSAILGF